MTDTTEPPRSDPAFRCAPWTRALGVDPIGSTARFDALLLVEWPLPWPSDVSAIPELAGPSATPGLRVMTVVPQSATSAAGMARVVHRWRTGLNHLPGVDHVVPIARVPQLVEDLAHVAMVDSSQLATAAREAPPEVLVCAHGRRDPCCGRWGTLLHTELAAAHAEVRVWRTSHTGGHRFAPTAVTLPEGRAWAYADVDLLGQVIARSGDGRTLGPHDRGTSSLSPWLQVLERAVMAELGWSWLDVRDVEHSEALDDDGDAADVELRWSGGWAKGRVTVLREVPVLQCGQPPETAAKTSPELGLQSFAMG